MKNELFTSARLVMSSLTAPFKVYCAMKYSAMSVLATDITTIHSFFVVFISMVPCRCSATANKASDWDHVTFRISKSQQPTDGIHFWHSRWPQTDFYDRQWPEKDFLRCSAATISWILAFCKQMKWHSQFCLIDQASEVLPPWSLVFRPLPNRLEWLWCRLRDGTW